MNLLMNKLMAALLLGVMATGMVQPIQATHNMTDHIVVAPYAWGAKEGQGGLAMAGVSFTFVGFINTIAAFKRVIIPADGITRVQALNKALASGIFTVTSGCITSWFLR